VSSDRAERLIVGRNRSEEGQKGFKDAGKRTCSPAVTVDGKKGRRFWMRPLLGYSQTFVALPEGKCRTGNRRPTSQTKQRSLGVEGEKRFRAEEERGGHKKGKKILLRTGRRGAFADVIIWGWGGKLAVRGPLRAGSDQPDPSKRK